MRNKHAGKPRKHAGKPRKTVVTVELLVILLTIAVLLSLVTALLIPANCPAKGGPSMFDPPVNKSCKSVGKQRDKPDADRLPTPLGPDDLDSLMRRVKDGALEAFRQFISAAGPLIEAVQRPLLNPGERDDARQEVFLRCWKARGTFRRDSGTAAAWLARIARNVAVDIRRKHRRLEPISDDSIADESRDPSETAEVRDWADFAKVIAEDVLTTAPAHHRVIWELRIEQGLPWHEVANAVGRSVGTCAGALHRLLARVRTTILDTTRSVPESGDQIMSKQDHDPAPTAAHDAIRTLKEGQTRLEEQQRSLQEELCNASSTVHDALGALQEGQTRLEEQQRSLQEELCNALRPPLLWRDRLADVHDRLEALADGKDAGDGAATQSVRLAELDDAIDHLAPLKDHLPKGLFTKLWAHAQELRDRLREHGFDAYAYNQVLALAARVRTVIG